MGGIGPKGIGKKQIIKNIINLRKTPKKMICCQVKASEIYLKLLEINKSKTDYLFSNKLGLYDSSQIYPTSPKQLQNLRGKARLISFVLSPDYLN